MNNIRAIRERLGLTQQALAAGMGCTQGNVGHYERGQNITAKSASRLIAFARTCGLAISFDHVFGSEELPPLVPAAKQPEAGDVRQAAVV